MNEYRRYKINVFIFATMKEATKKTAKLIHLDNDTINKIAHKAVDAGKSVKKYMEDVIKEIAAK